MTCQTGLAALAAVASSRDLGPAGPGSSNVAHSTHGPGETSEMRTAYFPLLEGAKVERCVVIFMSSFPPDWAQDVPYLLFSEGRTVEECHSMALVLLY